MFRKNRELRAAATASPAGLEAKMSKGLSDVARAKIELMNLIRGKTRSLMRTALSIAHGIC